MTPPFTGPKSYVEYVENTLGWAPDTSKVERWKAILIEASKVKRKIATDPSLYTWENLALTVEWLRQRHEEVRTPTSVLWRVEAALKDTATAKVPVVAADVAEQIREAVIWEQTTAAPGFQGWVSRLTRAAGTGREGVLAEWRTARAQ